MSFYLGTDNANKKVMHITKGVNTIPQLKSGVLSNTIFHSSLPYLRWEERPVINVAVSGGITTATISPSVAEELRVNKYGFLFIVDGQLYNTGSLHRIVQFSTQIAYGIWTNGSDFSGEPSSTYNRYRMSGSFTQVKLIFLTNTYRGLAEIPSLPGNDILVSNAGIMVNGVNLTSLKYLSNGVINGIDTVFSVGGRQFQLVDGAGLTQGILVKANQEAKVLSGNKEIFSTLGNGHFSIKSTATRVFSEVKLNPVRESIQDINIPISISSEGFIYFYVVVEQTVTTEGGQVLTADGVNRQVSVQYAYASTANSIRHSEHYIEVLVTTSNIRIRRIMRSYGDFATTFKAFTCYVTVLD